MNTPFPETMSEEYRKQTHCPSCGRFSGVFTRCPYCQAAIPKRLSIRVFKIIAVITSTVGLLLLLFFAQNVKSPLVRISELGPLSNFAHVRMEGTVSSSYGIHPKWGSLAFTLEQKGAAGQPLQIRISAYSKVAEEIGAQSKVPTAGDVVSVEGQVRFQKDSPSLLINASEHLSILHKGKEPTLGKALPPEEITQGMVGQSVRVFGVVTGTRAFDTGEIITLKQGNDGFPVWVPVRFRPDQQIVKGMSIEASGKVKNFKQELEVEVVQKGALKILATGGATTGAGKTANDEGGAAAGATDATGGTGAAHDDDKATGGTGAVHDDSAATGAAGAAGTTSDMGDTGAAHDDDKATGDTGDTGATTGGSTHEGSSESADKDQQQ